MATILRCQHDWRHDTRKTKEKGVTERGVRTAGEHRGELLRVTNDDASRRAKSNDWNERRCHCLLTALVEDDNCE